MTSREPTFVKSLRLFVAFWPDEQLRTAIANWQQAWTWPPRAALVRSDRFHLTLHFLGSVPAHRLNDVVQASSCPFQPFVLEFGHGQIWPHGVAVLRPDKMPATLRRLQTALGHALSDIGLPTEARPYRPHITLAHRSFNATPPVQSPGLRWEVNSGYALVQSLPGGAGYEVLASFK